MLWRTPHYAGLVQMLLRTPERVNARGQICLTAGEAAHMRALDFATAAEGTWDLPPFPDYVVRLYPGLGRLTEAAKRREERRSEPSTPMAGSSAAPMLSRVAKLPLSVLLVRRAREATPDQRRILRSVLASRMDWLQKRRLQHRLHRMPLFGSMTPSRA